MQVTVETTQGLERRLSITVPVEHVEPKVTERLSDIAQKASIEGFRPGKVPASVIKQRYGASVREEVVYEQMQRALGEALQQNKLEVAGLLALDPKVNEAGQPLEFTALVEVYPEFELKTLKGAPLDVVKAEVSDADVDNMIEKLRAQRAEWQSVERPITDKDKVTLDFEGLRDGEAFAGGKAENFEIEIGSGRLIPGFEDGLKGLSVGDEKDLNLSFPTDYHAAELAGAEVVFKIKVKKIEAAELPEVNDEFVKHFEVEDGTVEGLRAKLRANIEREADMMVVGKNKSTVFDKLGELNDIEVPKSLVDREVDHFLEESRKRMGIEEMPALPEDRLQTIRDEAANRVKLSLLLRAYIDQQALKVDGEQVRAKIESYAASYDTPEDVVKYYYSNQELLSSIESVVLEEQVMAKLQEEANISEKSVPFETLAAESRG